ncbi:hypothetical protein B4168_2834 [Anoxybacillus flavithermus]|nr:hypothetical protein B4168_2834 [Anoxybacillus flavithermus]OAO84891.1 hypothetical protein GT23_3277 [Parageobacillus thermoglucosidasius]
MHVFYQNIAFCFAIFIISWMIQDNSFKAPGNLSPLYSAKGGIFLHHCSAKFRVTNVKLIKPLNDKSYNCQC